MTESNSLAEPSVIKINLGDSLHAKEFDPGRQELIHPFEYDKAKKLITRRIDDAKQNDSSNIRTHKHEAITVLGTRGSGKTSFLLTLKMAFEKDNLDVQVLRIIDPTLIEDKGHVFLTIISSVAEVVEEALDKQETKPPETMNTRKEWRDKMLILAAGLPGLDGIGNDHTDGWNDPEFVMDSGMKAVKAAKNMSVNFDEFLKVSLGILRKKAFLLFFDDIDVNAKKGIDVLETIRKYLVTSRMITVVSGDIGLYMLVIRNKKWENFGKDLLKCEGEIMEKMPFFNEKVTELTTQYLLKVMQPAYRVHLTTLLEKRYTQSVKRIRILSEKEEKGEGKDIGVYYDQIFNKMGVRNVTQLEVYTTFMLGLPVRTQIQFLQLSKDLDEGSEKNTEVFSDVFIADLTEKNVDIALANQTPKYLCAVILRLLLNKRKLLDLYQLQPTTTDSSLNGSMMALWILFGWYTNRKNSFLVFDYFIKIAYIRNLLTLIPYRDTVGNQKLSDMPDIEDFCEVGDVFNDGVLRDVASAMQSYLLGALERKGNVESVSPYFTRLYSLKSVSKSRRNDTIDVVFNNSSKSSCIFAFIPCYSSTYANKNESKVMYSIYVLIATIGELIKRHETVNLSKQEMGNALKQLSQFRSYIIPDFKDSRSGVTQEDGSNNEQPEDLPDAVSNGMDNTDKGLAELVHSWIEAKPKIAVSTHLLGKIMTRFVYAMNNIASSYNQDKSIKLGELFYYQVTSFMNAVLVEDVTENGDMTSLNINNTRLSDVIFHGNLIKVIRWGGLELNKLNLSRWLLSCPLLYGYMRWVRRNERHMSIQEGLTVFCKGFIDNRCFDLSISRELDDVGIVSTKRTTAGSPALLNDYDELIRYLKDKKVPKGWFTYRNAPEIMNKWDNNIIQRESVVFGTGDAAVKRIAKFREYFRYNRDKWK